jgi:hypothetical protein
VAGGGGVTATTAMVASPSPTPSSARRHRWVQAALAFVALALMFLAAALWWGQRQSPLVIAALHQTGGRLLLHTVQGANVRILVVDPTIRRKRPPIHPHDCMVAEYAASTTSVQMRSQEVGNCAKLLISYTGLPQLMIRVLSLLLFPD